MLIVISYTNPEPIFRQIIDQVKTAITTGELAGGEKLPSIREMASELKVSVITVKRAYNELESEGLIMTRAGLGSFVAEVDQEQVKIDLFSGYRLEMEKMIASANAHDIPIRELKQLFDQIFKEDGEKKGRKE